MSVAAASQDRSWLRRLAETKSIAWYGIGLGVLAFWLALPPWDVRFEGGPIAVGIAGLAAGIWAVSRGRAAARLVGGRGRDRAAPRPHSGLQTKDTRLARRGRERGPLRRDDPLRHAARVRRDGRHLLRALRRRQRRPRGDDALRRLLRDLGAAWSGSWVVGILMAMVFGGALALIHAFFSIHLRADQIVSGFAINFLALGLTGYLFRSSTGPRERPRTSRASRP